MLYRSLFSLVITGSLAVAQTAAPKNIILFIGDGMGPQQVLAARMYQGAPLSFESLPYQALCMTHSANASVTDSAAAATAIATGAKVDNGVISMALPGDGSELETLLEFYRDQGKKTGLITTAYLTHATPAAFGAHESSRNNTSQIGADYLSQTLPNLLFGGGGNGLTETASMTAGYSVATDTAGFFTLTPSLDYLSGQFGTGYMPYEYDYLSGGYPFPHLTDMVVKALNALEDHPEGFFLMVEAGRIDHACEANSLQRAVHETLELGNAVQAALNWMTSRTDTLLLVTADHETGGLTVNSNNGTANYPSVSWSTGGHTAANVPVYAVGPNAGQVAGLLDNTDLYTILAGGTLLVPAGSLWRYLADGIDQGTAWRAPGFNDSSWPTGPAQLGYGDGDEATLIPSSPVRWCYYFRHTFTVADPAAHGSLTLSLLRDDGAVVYLNGMEVFRSNLADLTIKYDTPAGYAVGEPEEDQFFQTTLDPALLVEGANVLAVELHQSSLTSSDISFDLSLKAARYTGEDNGAVTLLDPANGMVVTTSSQAFVADLVDPDGLASATLVLAEATDPVIFSGPTLIDDAQITADTPNTPTGGSTSINVDSLAPHAHAVIRFNDLIGNGPGQIPSDASITSAILAVNCTNPGNTMTAYRLLEDWDEAEVTWNKCIAGTTWSNPGADGAASHDSTGLPADCSATGWRLIDITDFVQDWANGAANHGLVFIDNGTDGVDFDSSESVNSPVLTVYFNSSPVVQSVTFDPGLTATQVSFGPVTLVEGVIYSWNCRLLDALGNESRAPAPATFTYDTHYPDLPALVGPADGATGVATSPTLEVTVSDHDAGDTLDVTFFGRPAIPSGEPFTIVALPDTQFYSESYSAIFTAQTQWIVNQQAELNIVFVTHEGDIVNLWDNTTQWASAYESLNILKTAGIPFGMAPGNHDQQNDTGSSYHYNLSTQPFFEPLYQPTLLATYADPARPTDLNDNSAHLFSAGGVDLLLVQLEYSPSSDVLNWADDIIQSYPYRLVILTTHAYLNLDGSLSQPVIYNSLVAPNPNVRLVLCGHVSGEARRTDLIGDRQVHQLLADYQNLPNGGDGYLRVLRFLPNEGKVYVETYSPKLQQPQTDSDSQFELDMPLDGFRELATVRGLATGENATFVWSDLNLATDYEWYVLVTDSTGRRSQSPVWSFRTVSNDSTPPQISHVEAAPTDVTATITWTTDEDATSVVHYRLGPAEPPNDWIIVSDFVLTQNHSVTLTGLSPKTAYTFEVQSADAAQPPNLSLPNGPYSFTTLPRNDPPTADDKNVYLTEDTYVDILLTGSDPNSDPLEYRITSGPSHGDLSGTPPAVTYTPDADYFGSDSFQFVANDGQLDSTSATITISVSAVNDPPTAPADLSATAGDGMVTLSWTPSFDPDGDDLTYEVVRNDDSVASGLTQESFVDSPLINDVTYSYIIRVSDGFLSAETGDISVTPNALNPNAYVVAEPTIIIGSLGGGSYEVLDPEDSGEQRLTEIRGGQFGRLEAQYVLQTPAPPNSISGVSLHLSGTLTADDAPWRVFVWRNSQWTELGNLPQGSSVDNTFTLSPSDVAPDGTIQIAILDGADIKRESYDTLTLQTLYAEIQAGPAVNRPPVAADIAVSTALNTAVDITLLGTDVDGDSLTYSIEVAPSNGTATRSGDVVTYEPNEGFTGEDSFEYRVTDPDKLSATATVNITVTELPVFSVKVGLVSITSAGKNSKATAEVEVLDSSGNPVVGATVTGEWFYAGESIGATSGVTDSSGVTLLTSPPVKTRDNLFSVKVLGVELGTP